MKAILSDLLAEQSLVDTLVSDLSEEQWLKPLPVEMWNIKDAIIHIAFFDYAANKLMSGEAEDLVKLADAESGQDQYVRATSFHHLTGAEVLSWWREERTRMAASFYEKNSKDRIPWAPGLPMSAKSLASARLMELWAHSVDIYDALGLEPVVRERITSTLFLSWQARPNAYRINDLEMPATPIYLELILPSGEIWAKGEPSAENRIKGSAKDWALVAIRRRNWMDTDLEVVGEEAQRYASIVQTYAGWADPAPAAKRQR
ncbi:TIGR03084 family metal-binding protein [Desulfitobacterium sp. PCE1]|uniref:TIGR03084 family metal-binding protein n=1 Tax=Desulfitobacterium sp. PCE1 TaxID=146907 RepID=UPI000361AA28|nr:TIGR03084 family metal-binding protein [Desulfitobacterium sp. PCE1]